MRRNVLFATLLSLSFAGCSEPEKPARHESQWTHHSKSGWYSIWWKGKKYHWRCSDPNHYIVFTPG